MRVRVNDICLNQCYFPTPASFFWVYIVPCFPSLLAVLKCYDYILNKTGEQLYETYSVVSQKEWMILETL